jgi:glyoxylase-like metal-dependent hydrolase (beta-lactamase superfamily II)
MVNIHQFKSRAEGFCVNSWILETETSLILVDSQFLVSEVEGLLSQIRKLGKPLEATFITHPHPDHFNGAGLISLEFPRARIISTAQTAAGIERNDAAKREYWTPVYKTDYPSFTKFPTERLESGCSVTIASLEFVLEDVGPGECENMSVIWLPGERILFPGDLIYNRVHPWLAEGRSTAWLTQITLALLEMITELRDRNRARAHPRFVPIDLRQQHGHGGTCGRFVRIALNCPKHSFSLDPRPMQILLGPTKLPDSRSFLTTHYCKASALHCDSPSPRFGAEEFSRSAQQRQQLE